MGNVWEIMEVFISDAVGECERSDKLCCIGVFSMLGRRIHRSIVSPDTTYFRCWG